MISYKINSYDACLSVRCFLSGAPYGIRHWEVSNRSNISCSAIWGHRIISVLEWVPVLGFAVAMIDLLVASIYKKSIT